LSEASNFQNFNLTGKTLLVTGGATGIGWAIACAAEQCGARVAIVDLVKPLANALESAGVAQRLAITANVCPRRAPNFLHLWAGQTPPP
jgi:NAD(P)-dependent dehydrogenase (short-subunit alcohol dehydrogenase family)